MTLPPDTPDAARRRRTLLSKSSWLTADEAGARLGGTANVKELRKTRQLLGVWDPDHRTWHYPAFQFEGDGVRPVIAVLLSILPSGDGSGWSQIEWLYSPHRLTDCRPPFQMIESEPDRVLGAAREEYESHRDARW